ncbi:hypothetical protein KIPB_014514 [Kipferlia bialata]|uniref:Uncharacterized protein n=1 Tax=Kipferlia bialata TaxID=797122 RepID=A0A9K3D9C8_9EUKA|nr:hypothetical protein KIPB_014514 [Kipferlia bialata]|eukprot:g14514.t1
MLRFTRQPVVLSLLCVTIAACAITHCVVQPLASPLVFLVSKFLVVGIMALIALSHGHRYIALGLLLGALGDLGTGAAMCYPSHYMLI